MVGRGFLKSRLAQIAAQEVEDASKSENNNSIDVSTINNEPILGNNKPAARGRRAIFSRSAENSEFSETSRLSSLTLENSKNPECQMFPVPPVCQNGKVPKQCTSKIQLQSTTNLQQHPIPTEALTENNKPVICRVTENHKNNFKMTKLSSNYIKIEIEKEVGIFKYCVDFDPPVDIKSAKFYLLNQHNEKLPVKTFDGALLFVPIKLPQNVTNLMGTLKDGTEVKIKITYKSKNALNDSIHFYNMLFRRIINILGFVEFGRGHYDPIKKIELQQFQLEIWPGFITSIDQFENGLYMCCDVVHRVLRLQNCSQIMAEIAEEAKSRNKDVVGEIMAQLCGTTVITHYNSKTYRIDDIDFSMSPLSTFLKNGSEISYVSYYKNGYNIDIQNHQQPMIITKPKKKNLIKNGPQDSQDSDLCCLVPELCYLTGLSESMKNNYKLMSTISTHTKVDPNIRQNTLIEFVNRINDCEDTKKKLKDWGLSISPSLVISEGPVYKNESVIFGNQKKIPVENNMDWTMNVKKNLMFTAVKIINWAILYNSRDLSTARSFCKCLALCSQPLGMKINEPMPISVDGISPEAFVTSINNAVKCNSELQLVVVIFPSKRDDRYNAVKRICCSEIGIPSQVIISRTLSNPTKMRSFVQKIALQINCKLGGAGWSIDIPLNNCMIVGIDVYHEKNKQMSSVIGFVASLDKTFTQWYSVAKIQKNTHKEIGDVIHIAFFEILDAYKEKNGKLPEKIIIYRDGIGDGDIIYTEEFELRNLEEYLKTYSNNYCPMITYIIVQKRINTKIFRFLDEKYSNPSPGTVLDNTITKRNYFDFYLVSQNVRQGTVNPTHYVVLKNGCNLSVENVQRLSYKLCHLYYNWCGTIKIPAPVQYAHKLAYLIGENIRIPTKRNLCNTLYYL